MRRTPAAIGSAIFFAVAPGSVAGLGPWLITRWQVSDLPDNLSWAVIPLRVVGAVLVLAGVAVLIHAFVRFVAEGAGTPAPVAPPEHLVIGGLYRYVRNPMYVGVLSAIIGQALLLGQFGLFWYAATVFLAFFLFVRIHEEPALRRTFGTAYDEYRTAVPGWLPRLRPWSG
ncbi:isoprenylcysteine carboxylmethyltransferase family protein [Acrocarpospora sp. B8E8]|uniref:methyltransferase family protein n=1 Tax=Acrocarpospora sp. B8E8 TaxID=3153572 RepID=UPI00325C981F